MTRAADSIPAETDLLCQSCGYILTGLGDTLACPECGKPVIESTRADLRQPSLWESDPENRSKLFRLILTSAEIIFRPERFYRSITTRTPTSAPRRFARIHRVIASVVLAPGVAAHVALSNGWLPSSVGSLFHTAWILPLAFVIILFGFEFTTSLAGRLTAWEARMRGYRLPVRAVARGLDYHSADLFPVALLLSATMIGNYVLFAQGVLSVGAVPAYLYTLSGEVVIAAIYLFITYWTAMRSMLYANQ